MIIKIFLGCVMVAAFSLVGVKLSENKRFIKDLFEKLKAFNLELSADVGLYSSPIVDKLSAFNRSVDGVIDGFDAIERGGKFECRDKRLSKDQREFITLYVNSLGRFDEKRQIDYQVKTDKRIDSILLSCVESHKKYSALSFKLAFCFGLTVFIIII